MHGINNFKTAILDVSANTALKVIYGTKKEEWRGWRTLHNKQLRQVLLFAK